MAIVDSPQDLEMITHIPILFKMYQQFCVPLTCRVWERGYLLQDACFMTCKREKVLQYNGDTYSDTHKKNIFISFTSVFWLDTKEI